MCVFSDDDQEELDSDEEYYSNHHNIDTSRVDEIPAKEPKFNAVPLKSALKKKSSNPGTPTQESNRTLLERQANSSFKWVPAVYVCVTDVRTRREGRKFRNFLPGPCLVINLRSSTFSSPTCPLILTTTPCSELESTPFVTIASS